MSYFKVWIKKAGIRAMKTFAQTAASLITVGSFISDIEWGLVFSAAAVAAIYSLLTSVAGLPEIDDAVVKGADGDEGEAEDTID